MPGRNVTITLPDETLKLARHLAVEDGLSLSRFLERLVEDHAGAERARAEARSRWMALMSEGIELGFGSSRTWRRDELHER